jgi:KDO2-lipid IV(A) lauroyltransferase
LPLELLFRISDFLYFLIYTVFKYRVKVVKTNIKNAFPNYSEAKHLEIERSFYIFLCDLFVEIIKAISITETECKARYCVSEKAKQVMGSYLEKQQSIILTLGHYGNWELGGAIFGRSTGMYVNVIYRPLSNAFAESLMKNIRSKFGNFPIPMHDTFKTMLSDKKNNLTRATAFAIDQAAPPESAYWTLFLNQESSVFLGAEKLAHKLNYPVVHVYASRIKRGYYTIHVNTISENPKALAAGELTELITKDIEKIIVAAPETWLWSHRRWKHQREEKNPHARLPSKV